MASDTFDDHRSTVGSCAMESSFNSSPAPTSPKFQHEAEPFRCTACVQVRSEFFSAEERMGKLRSTWARTCEDGYNLAWLSLGRWVAGTRVSGHARARIQSPRRSCFRSPGWAVGPLCSLSGDLPVHHDAGVLEPQHFNEPFVPRSSSTRPRGQALLCWGFTLTPRTPSLARKQVAG